MKDRIITQEVDLDFLKHFGVKGMKWGVTKARSTGRTKKSTDISKLSDSELQARVKRLNLERQYSDLVNKKQEPVSIGAKFVRGIIVSAGKQVLTEVIKSQFRLLINQP